MVFISFLGGVQNRVNLLICIEFDRVLLIAIKTCALRAMLFKVVVILMGYVAEDSVKTHAEHSQCNAKHSNKS